MEADRDAIREARATFAREIGQIKATVAKSGQRLAESASHAKQPAFPGLDLLHLRSFCASVGMVGIGAGRRVDQGLSRDGAALLIQSCIATLRDMHEGTKLVNRIEDARAERLLMEIERGKE